MKIAPSLLRLRHSAGCCDAQFIELLDACRPFGGLLRHCDIPAVSAPGCGWQTAPIVLEWDHQYWLPAFQFRCDPLRRCSSVECVVAEMRPVFDDIELIHWFLNKNCWLGGAAPLDRIADDLRRVLGAARTDRYIAAG